MENQLYYKFIPSISIKQYLINNFDFKNNKEYFYDFTPECFSYLNNNNNEDKFNDIFKDFKKDDYKNSINIIKNNILNKIKEENFDNRKTIIIGNNIDVFMNIEDINLIDSLFKLKYSYYISAGFINNNNLLIRLNNLYSKYLYDMPIKFVIAIYHQYFNINFDNQFIPNVNSYNFNNNSNCIEDKMKNKIITVENDIININKNYKEIISIKSNNNIYNNIDINILYNKLLNKISLLNNFLYSNNFSGAGFDINDIFTCSDGNNPYDNCEDLENFIDNFKYYKRYEKIFKLLNIYHDKFNKLQKENEKLKRENDNLKKRNRDDDDNNEINKKIKQ